MAYSADDHGRFSRRMQKFFVNLQALRNEAKQLQEIYTNETASGADAEFVSTEIAEKQEHIAGITYIGAFGDFNENAAVATANRVANITPFVQVE